MNFIFFSWIVIFVQYLYAKSFRRTIRMQMTLKRWQKRYVMNKNNICSFFPRFFVYISYRFYLYTLIMTINLTFTGRWQTTKRWFIRRFAGEQSQHCRLERQQKNRIVCRSRCIYTRLFKGTNFEFFIEKLSIFRNSWKQFFSLFIQTHLPGYVEKADEIKAGGVDEIVCVSVNDAFVLSAWGKEHKTGKLTIFHTFHQLSYNLRFIVTSFFSW